MMRFAIFPENVALAGRSVYQAFCDYIAYHTEHTFTMHDYNADCAIIWSVLWNGRMEPNRYAYDEFKRQGKPVIILEVGALKRNETWRVAVNHIDNTGFYGNVTLLNIDRPAELELQLDPWRPDVENGNIIICGQHTRSQLWRTMPDQTGWVLRVAKNLREELDNPIVFRPHPRCKDYSKTQLAEHGIKVVDPLQIPGTYDDFDFEKALDTTSLVYTHTSNAGIHAVMKGVPIYCSDNGLARAVRVKADQVKPDREDWFIKLCHTEWTIEEIQNGIPFRRIERYLLKR